MHQKDNNDSSKATIISPANFQNMCVKRFEWVDRLFKYWDYSDHAGNRKLDCQCGEIYEIDFGVNINAEFSGRHYGVVVANSHIKNPLVTVIPLKTKKRPPNPASDINLGFINDLDTQMETIAVVTQIKGIDKIRIYDQVAINKLKNGIGVPKLTQAQIKLLRNAITNLLLF